MASSDSPTAENCRHSGFELGRLYGKRQAWSLGRETSQSLASQTLEDIVDLGAAQIATMQLLEMECRGSVYNMWFDRGFAEGDRQGWIEVVGYDPDGHYPGEHLHFAPIADNDFVSPRRDLLGESPRSPASVSSAAE